MIKSVNKDDVLVHLAYNTLRPGELPKDFVLLVSKRAPLEKYEEK